MALRRSSGAALVLALVIILIVTGLGVAFLMIVMSSAKQSQAGRHLDEAEEIAESGMNLTRRFMFVYFSDGTWTPDQILQYNQSFSTDPAAIRSAALDAILRDSGGTAAVTWPEAPVPPDRINPTTVPPFIFGAHTLFGSGSWYVVAKNNPEDPHPLVDTDNIFVLYVTGTTPEGRQRQLEVRVAYVAPAYVPVGAIVCGGTLRIEGNPKITALPGVPSADVVSNGNIVISGDAQIDGRAVASGAVDVRGNPTIRDGTLSGVPKTVIPKVDPEQYRTLATYVFGSNGVVTDAAGLTAGVGRFYNFEFENGKWKVEDDDPVPPSGVYFFETDVKLTGQASYQATIISKGDIEMAGRTGGGATLTLSSYLQNVALLSGGDISTRGRARVRGILAAREQMNLDGTVVVTDGGLIIADEDDRSSAVRRDSRIGGNITIEYRNGQPTFLKVDQDALQVLNIRRLR